MYIPKPQSRSHPLLRGVRLYKGVCVCVCVCTSHQQSGLIWHKMRGNICIWVYGKRSGSINELCVRASMRRDKRHLIGKVCESSWGRKGGVESWRVSVLQHTLMRECVPEYMLNLHMICVKNACLHSEFYHLANTFFLNVRDILEWISSDYLTCVYVCYD